MSACEDEEAARRARAQDIALFRRRLISPALEPGLSPRARGRMLTSIAERVHASPGGQPARVSRKSLDRWIRAWRAGGFEALAPSPRRVGARTDAEVLALASALKRENPERTAEQVRRILIEGCRGQAPSARTLQRHFARQEINTPRNGPVFGRFEAEAPNDLRGRRRPPRPCGRRAQGVPLRVHRRPFPGAGRLPAGMGTPGAWPRRSSPACPAKESR
jgi:putative transposase